LRAVSLGVRGSFGVEAAADLVGQGDVPVGVGRGDASPHEYGDLASVVFAEGVLAERLV
jgi:hypothetical protein